MRIGFLHAYKMADHYFVETVETAAIADLCADGHDAEAVDFLFENDRSEGEQLSELRAALEREGYDLIFLERAWSDEVMTALRGLPIVGWGTNLEGRVDVSVVEPRRSVVRDLVRAWGGPLDAVKGLSVRGSTTHSGQKVTVVGELTDATFEYRRRRSLSRRAANADRAIVLSNFGCAYRNVPNKTGTFDGVEMPGDVSTAGCTFCNADPYERIPERDAIAFLVKQIGAVLEQRPEVREIAIKDDYAVRFIARLGEALRPLPLGDRRVLMSARADYLLDMRSAIEEALGGAFPAALGFYLIGFENFSDAELTRFNKGMSAAQMERSIALMREWSERFPGRFTVSPTGGFILFTPWTTLNDLRINADVMRRLGFEKFRGRALLSQLRLYPHLPLYWLAKRDGLLLDRYVDPSDSDAARRGYEADHPWRFADSKVALVHRRLLDEAPGADDARLFEIFEQALDDAAGIARGKKGRPLRMVAAPNDVARKGPSTQQITLNRACNHACTFCVHHGEETLSDRARATRAIHAVKTAARNGVSNVVLTGAEPTLEWYLPDLIKLARNIGIPEVTLETNAAAIEDAAALKEAGLTRARVALNHLDEATSNAITRGDLGATLRGIRALRDAGIQVELAVALLRENVGALEVIVRSGLATTVLARYIGAGPPGFVPLAAADAARELERAVLAAGDVQLRAAVDGELPPCVFHDPSGMRDVLRVGRSLVERDSGRHRRIPQCEGCAAREVCPGPLEAARDSVAAAARTLRETDRLDGIVQLTRERTRQLQEYRSKFFLESMSGLVERRIVRVNFHCNQACDFCFVSRELPPIEHEIIEREIREAAEAKAVLDLSGGEPTLNARLPEYIRLARSLGVRELDLQTNAIKMSDPSYARELVDAGLQQAFVSLHGVTAATSDRVTAAPGTFGKTISGIKNLLAAGAKIRVNFVLCGYNVEDLAKLPDFIRTELGDADIVANFSFVAASTDNVPRDTKLIPRFRDVAWALERAHTRAVERGLPWTGFDSKCGVPACYLPRAIREEHFTHDLPAEELARAKGFTKSAACADCELDKRCYGIRSTYAAMYGVEELRPIQDGKVQAPRAPQHAERTWADEHPGGDHRELVQLRAGLRSVIKTERATLESAVAAADAATASGLVARVFRDSTRSIAFIGRDLRAVDEAMEIEPQLIGSFRDRLNLVLRMGELLGYPECCSRRFAESREQTDAALVRLLASEQRSTLPPELNWAAADIRLFSHFPCSPTCARTLEVAKSTLGAIQAERPAYAKALLDALRSVAIVSSSGQYALLVGARGDGPDAYRYESVLSHRNLGVDARMIDTAIFRTFYDETVRHLERGNRIVQRGAEVRIENDGLIASTAAFVLDFTGAPAVRRLPVLEGRA
jgi:molybdenum cofactor biosynthesis enzyme MoaA